MSPDQVNEVLRAWHLVQPVSLQVGLAFYERLFQLAPQLRPLFRSGDRFEQARQLMQMLDGAVKLLQRRDAALLEHALQALGRRHAGYGVRAEHYAPVGQALLETLAAQLGPAFTPAAHAAWAELYGVVSQTMLDAAAVSA